MVTAKKPDLGPQVEPLPSRDISEGETELVQNPKDLPADEFGQIEEALRNYVPGTDEEKRLVRKVDMYLIPMLWWMCVLCYLDRNNIGNAKAAGMADDLNLSDNDYSMLITIFFVAYIIWEIPSNLIMTRARLSWYLPGLMFVWGAVVIGMSQVKTYRHILVTRFFLALIEAGFFPGVLYIMTCWYKRNEIGKRFSIFYTALTVAGAVSGLISGAVITGLEGHHGIRGWRYLFIVEGGITMGMAVVAFCVLPDFPHQSSRRFTTEERILARARLMHDKAESGPARRKLTPLQSVHATVVDLRTYYFIVLYMTQNGSGTVSYFIPTVLKSMGYTGTKAQWMTVPIWATSDRYNDRRWHIVGGMSLAFISAVVSVSVTENSVCRYVMMCFYISGLYTTLPLILNWASEIMALPAEKRAVTIATINSLGCFSSIYGGYLWPSSDAPNYTMGFATVSAFIGLGVILAAMLPIVFKHLPKNTTRALRELQMESEEGTV